MEEEASVVIAGPLPERKKPDGSANFVTGGKKGRTQPTELLRAMRWVSTNDETPGESHLRKTCRDLLKQDQKAFIAQLARLEAEQRAARTKLLVAEAGAEGGSAPGKAAPDHGADRCIDLAEQLLREAAAS